MHAQKVFGYSFEKIYGLYRQKVEKKGRTRQELDAVLGWLTGYDPQGMQAQMEAGSDLETFFAQAPEINPHAGRIKGMICGVRVESIEDPLMQKIRYMDKLVDELSKGKPLEKILR